MKKSTFVTTALLSASVTVLLSGSAYAEGFGAGGDNKSSSYTNTYAPPIIAGMKEKGHSMPLRFGNSVVNLKGLYAEDLDAVLAQGDVHSQMTLDDEYFAEGILSAAAVGAESALCAYNVNGRLTTFGQLLGDEPPALPFKISAGIENSGTFFSIGNIASNMEYMSNNIDLYKPTEKEFRKAARKQKIDVAEVDPATVEVKYSALSELDRLRTGIRDLVCEMMTPDALKKEGFVFIVMEDPAFDFMTIDHPDLEKIKDAKGRQTYRIAEATVGGNRLQVYSGFGSKKVTTIHTPVSVYYNADVADQKFIADLQAVVGNPDLLPAKTPAALAAKAWRIAEEKAGL